MVVLLHRCRASRPRRPCASQRRSHSSRTVQSFCQISPNVTRDIPISSRAIKGTNRCCCGSDGCLMMNPGRFNSELARTFSFGPFHLIPVQRLLLEGEKPLHLGSRALEILIALVERHSELVSKEEL